MNSENMFPFHSESEDEVARIRGLADSLGVQFDEDRSQRCPGHIGRDPVKECAFQPAN